MPWLLDHLEELSQMLAGEHMGVVAAFLRGGGQANARLVNAPQRAQRADPTHRTGLLKSKRAGLQKGK